MSQVHAFNAVREHKILIFVTVNTVEEAVAASKKWEADVIIAQGAEAGGRGNTCSPPTPEFVKSVVQTITDVIVLGAGGITTGTQVASTLTMGASGVVLGTRFLFTRECMWTDEMKSVLIEAGPHSTSRSPVYDIVFPPGVWPKGNEARCVDNAIKADYDAGQSPAEIKAKISSNKKEYHVLYAGVGVADVNEIKSTADIMHEIHAETVAALRATGSL